MRRRNSGEVGKSIGLGIDEPCFASRDLLVKTFNQSTRQPPDADRNGNPSMRNLVCENEFAAGRENGQSIRSNPGAVEKNAVRTQRALKNEHQHIGLRHDAVSNRAGARKAKLQNAAPDFAPPDGPIAPAGLRYDEPDLGFAHIPGVFAEGWSHRMHGRLLRSTRMWG